MKLLSALGISLFIVGLSLSQQAQAQELKVTGKIADEQKQALSFATIRAFQQADSSFVNGTVTGNDGLFELQLPEGKYYVETAFIGMNPKMIVLSKTSGTVDLGTVVLKTSSTVTSEVSVIADKSIAELKLDKRVYNVSADVTNQGANATEVLENIPSVTVDTEGNVSLRGNAGVLILIDGKMSGFSSTPEALQMLQADMIDRIEVITNASARYDAQGDAGIINIVLKKNKLVGWNGSANVNVGYYPELGGGFNLNYKKNRININTAYTFNRSENPSSSRTYQRLMTQDTTVTYRQLYSALRKRIAHTASLGLDYDLNEFNTISISGKMNISTGKNTFDRDYENLDVWDELLDTDSRVEWQSQSRNMREGMFSYHKRFSREGSSWTTEAKWTRSGNEDHSDFEETSSLNDEYLTEKSNASVTESNLLFQSDLILAFGEEGKFEAGVRSQQRNMLNRFGYSKLIEDVWTQPAKFNDDFEYNEWVHAGYLMASNTFNRWSAQVGVRGEYSDVSTEQYSLNDKNRRDYFDLFPSAALSYKSSDTRTFQLSYSRRINRPGQWSLMPFLRFGDNREMMVGNPYINPEYTDAIEGGIMQYFEKGSLLSTVYYRMTNQSIERMSVPGDDGIIYRINMNVGDRDAYGFEFNLNYTLLPSVKLNTGFNLYRQTVKGVFNEIPFESDNFSWTNRTSINVSLKNKLRMQLSSNYNGPRVTPQGRSLAMFFMDAGVTRDLSKNATLGLNVRDIFNTRRWRHQVDTETIYAETMFQWRPRSIKLVFTYRFNQKPSQQPKERMQEEMFEGE